MAKLKMLKIQIAAMLSDSKNIIDRLQRRGVVELSDMEEHDGITKLDTNSGVALFERNLALANSALDILKSYETGKKPLLAGLDGVDRMQTKKFGERAQSENKVFQTVNEVVNAERRIAKLDDEIAKSSVFISTLEPIKDFELSLDFNGTEKTAAIMGSFPSKFTCSEIAEMIGHESGIRPYVEIINDQTSETFCFVVTQKKDKTDALSVLRENGFAEIRIAKDKTAVEVIEEEKRMIAEKENEKEKLFAKLSEMTEKKDDILFFIDYLVMKIDKYNALKSVGMTERTIIIEGFIPEKYASKLEKEFEEKYQKIFISFSDPSEDEDVPVLLENSAFSAPLEGITKMYAMPGKKDIDPSSVMSFFYYLLFGMMLSDAGYGLLMALGCFFILKKFDIKEDLKKTLTLFRNCGVSTFIWGVLFGSWFGDLPQVIMTNFFGWEDFSTALWFEPLDDPITLLLFSFGLGIIHLFIGLGAHFHTLWRDGKKLDAVCEVIPTYITIIGVMPLGASVLTSVPEILTNIGSYFLIFGAVLVVVTSGRTGKNFIMRIFGGLYGLYNLATGYLGDILSYSRLLALGLATGSIASVINLIATMPQNKVLKLIMLLAVGVLGHAANMAINVLGAYVHTDRLQFVELFSKFYEGGGREFHPLKANTKSFKFEKENIYND